MRISILLGQLGLVLVSRVRVSINIRLLVIHFSYTDIRWMALPVVTTWRSWTWSYQSIRSAGSDAITVLILYLSTTVNAMFVY